MALHREIDGARNLAPAPVERLTGRHEWRRAESSWQLATGTLACPACDAPVLPEPGSMSLRDAISCGYCRYASSVRDFLSLEQPTRPTRVVVRVSGHALR